MLLRQKRRVVHTIATFEIAVPRAGRQSFQRQLRLQRLRCRAHDPELRTRCCWRSERPNPTRTLARPLQSPDQEVLEWQWPLKLGEGRKCERKKRCQSHSRM